MSFLMMASPASETFSMTLVLLFVAGFISAVLFGSIAWYNSKRPIGWKDKERPNIVPDVEV